MRKTSYAIAFITVAATLLLSVLSTQRPDWLVVSNSDIFHAKVTVQYGLMKRCERQIIVIPGTPEGGKLAYTDYKCRAFPLRVEDRCEKENKTACVMWSTAGYLSDLSIGFGAVACVAILFGVTTHSRRRRIWRAAAWLVACYVILQIATFAVVTDVYRNSRFPIFEQARPGAAYVFSAVSWVVGVLVTVGIIITGISANKGHRWAAGNRAYVPINSE